MNMERIIAKSFHQFQHERALPQHAKALAALEAQADAIEVAGEEVVAEFERLKREIADAAAVMMAEVLRPERCLRFMRPGRLVRIRVAGVDYGWGVVCGVVRRSGPAVPPSASANAPAAPPPPDPTSAYVLDTLLRVVMPGAGGGPPRPSPDGVAGELGVLPVALSCVSSLSALMVQLPDDLRSPDARAAVGLALAELQRRFPAGLPRLDPMQDMGIDDPKFVAAVRTIEALEPQLLTHPLFGPSAEAARYGAPGGGALSAADAALQARKEAFDRKAALRKEASQLRAKMRDSTLTRFRDELRSRSAVLRRLGHINDAGIVQLKGRAACEIDTGDELLVTELMFNGFFSGMSPAVCAAVCSCFVPTEKAKLSAPLPPELSAALATLHETAGRIAEVQVRSLAGLRATFLCTADVLTLPQADASIEINVEEYVDSFKPTLMDVIYRWVRCASAPRASCTLLSDANRLVRRAEQWLRIR